MWSLAAIAALLLSQPADFNTEGLKALEEQRYEEAAQAFQQALEADPEDYGAHFHLALAHSLLGHNTEAIAGYEKVLELTAVINCPECAVHPCDEHYPDP